MLRRDLRQVQRAIEQERNLDQLSISRFFYNYVAAHQGENSSLPEEMVFFPHPATWARQTTTQSINCSTKSAIEFLSTYKQFDSLVEFVFTPSLTELLYIAGD